MHMTRQDKTKHAEDKICTRQDMHKTRQTNTRQTNTRQN
jgi:hypothetical protein